MTDADLYELLGVGRDATDDELKRAYRQKAREFHPDANHGDEATEERFKEVSLAYEVLRDPERRARYDRFGAQGVFGQAAGQAGGGFGGGDPFGGGLGDLFDAFFNGAGGAGGGRGRRTGPSPGPDAEVILRLTFREAVFGVHREITVQTPVHCDTCEGSGAQPGTSVVRCPECRGSGELRRVRQSILGQVITAVPCNRCQGTGQSIESPCRDCGGDGRRTAERTLTVDVPAGVDEGSTLRLSGHGPAGFRGGPNGALFVHLAVEPDPVFERDGVDLHASVRVAMTQAALGTVIGFDTLDDERDLTVAPGTQTGEVLHLKGLGVPRLRGRGRGDLYVHVVVETPTGLGEAQRQLLVSLAEARDEHLEAPSNGDGLFSKLRSALS
ncbi:MAG: molecular chaperone DnaJ [Acidimicrobiales bacterium]|jgi:molecular chaperone DnaJ